MVDEKLKLFVKESRSGVLANLINNSEVHASALLYWTDDFKDYYFATDINTDKCQLIRKGTKNISASFVVGTEDDTEYSLQLDGVLNIVNDDKEKSETVPRFTEKQGEKHWDDNYALLKFSAKSGKYTDYTKGWDKYQLDF